MKQTRRKELKTNELSIYLHQMYETVQQNATYLLGGLVAIVAILVIFMYVQHRRHKTMADAWTSYYEIREKDVTKEAGALDRARELADKYGDNAHLGPAVMQLRGDMAYELSLSLVKPEEQTRRLDLLQESKETFEHILNQYGSDTQVAARAQISLAAIGESLVVLGKVKIEEVRGHYQALVEKKPNPFAEVSEKRLAELTKHLEPLNIVATRPAEPPESAPASTPAAVSARPATAPASVVAQPVGTVPTRPANIPPNPRTATATAPK